MVPPLVDFNNKTGVINGTGNLQLKTFDENNDTAMDITVQIQSPLLKQKKSMRSLFMALACIKYVKNKISNGVLLAQLGNERGRKTEQLLVFWPAGDGSAQLLRAGDHNLFYDSEQPGGPLTVIRGYDGNNRQFVMRNGQRYPSG